jgi:hypothetical protein
MTRLLYCFGRAFGGLGGRKHPVSHRGRLSRMIAFLE